MTGALATSRAAKGEKPDRGRDNRSGLVARGYRVQQVPWDQVKGGKTSSAGREVEANGMEACLARRSKTRTGVENQVRIAVQLSLRVVDRRSSQYTEVEREDIENS